MTPKQQRFVDEYLIDLNATQAAIRAGYSERTAGQQGFDLLKKPEIQTEITKRGERAADRLEVTVDRVLREYARIAFSDMRRFAAVEGGEVQIKPSAEWTDDDAAAVAEVSQNADGSIKFKLYPKTQALDALGKYLGMAVNRHEISTPTSAITTAEAIEKIEAAIAKVEAKRGKQ